MCSPSAYGLRRTCSDDSESSRGSFRSVALGWDERAARRNSLGLVTGRGLRVSGWDEDVLN